jgi:hypothetical protein
MATWESRIAAERKEAEHSAMLASDADTIGWDKLAAAQRLLVEACDLKVAALLRLKRITEDHDLWLAFDDASLREKVKKIFRDKGLSPPK